MYYLDYADGHPYKDNPDRYGPFETYSKAVRYCAGLVRDWGYNPRFFTINNQSIQWHWE